MLGWWLRGLRVMQVVGPRSGAGALGGLVLGDVNVCGLVALVVKHWVGGMDASVVGLGLGSVEECWWVVIDVYAVRRNVCLLWVMVLVFVLGLWLWVLVFRLLLLDWL